MFALPLNLIQASNADGVFLESTSARPVFVAPEAAAAAVFAM